jgi:hypothetical protein
MRVNATHKKMTLQFISYKNEVIDHLELTSRRA